MKNHDQMRLIGVLVVDDSTVTCNALTRIIESDPMLCVLGRAHDGIEALEKVVVLQPDVVTLDFEMPRMNGLETLQKIMQDMPRPVLMISRFTRKGAEVTLEALDRGAFDYIPKPESGAPDEIESIRNEIVAKIKVAASTYHRQRLQASVASPGKAVAPVTRVGVGSIRPEIVCIGTSTGGPKALQQILPMLPGDLPVGILVVQHMPPGFTNPFAHRMDDLCKVSVHEASHGEPIEPGVVYIAPAGLHMTVLRPPASKGMIQLSPEPAGTMHIPSVDVTMTSVAKEFRSRSMGIILTGMGSDGLLGMKAINAAGGRTIGQDESTCSVYGMPRACAETGVLHKVVPLLQVPEQILLATQYYLSKSSGSLPRTR